MRKAVVNNVVLLIDGNDFGIDLSSIDNISIDFKWVALNKWTNGIVDLICPDPETISYLIDHSLSNNAKYLVLSQESFDAYYNSDYYLYDSMMIKNNNITIDIK